MAAAARTTSARTLPIPRFDWEVWPHLADPVVDAAAPLAAGMKRLPARRRSRRAACCRRCRPRRPQAWRPRPRPRLPRPRRSRAGSTSRGLLWRSTGQMKGSVLHSRMESITAYTNERGQRRTGTAGQSATPVTADDMSAPNEWPSHARRNRARLEDEADGQKKRKGRGVLKGVKASMKRFASGSKKLDISFSETLGGTIGMNNRSFKDDVVISMKRKLPLIGARRWSDIHPTVHRLIVADMIDRYNLEDTPANEQKILKIAMERYRGWRATLSSTYKAYKTDEARLANVPEDIQVEEWEWMMDYFANDAKFKEHSQKNSDNRKKQKTKHRGGSKSYSQISFENRNVETGEEPDCIALWELTHTKNGTWSNTDSQTVYDKAREAVETKETETHGPLSSVQRSTVFQTAYKETLKCKSSQPRGYGNMAKPQTASERFQMQIEEQARATAETQQHNSELSQQVNVLQDKLDAERGDMQERLDLERAEREQLEKMLQEERAERERLVEEERRQRLESEKTMMANFNQQIAKLSQLMANQQQVLKKRTEKENSNPSLQNNVVQSSRPNMISSNQLVKNSRMYKAIDPKELGGQTHLC